MVCFYEWFIARKREKKILSCFPVLSEHVVFFVLFRAGHMTVYITSGALLHFSYTPNFVFIVLRFRMIAVV